MNFLFRLNWSLWTIYFFQNQNDTCARDKNVKESTHSWSHNNIKANNLILRGPGKISYRMCKLCKLLLVCTFQNHMKTFGVVGEENKKSTRKKMPKIRLTLSIIGHRYFDTNHFITWFVYFLVCFIIIYRQIIWFWGGLARLVRLEYLTENSFDT
jgi:hypothetical protein